MKKIFLIFCMSLLLIVSCNSGKKENINKYEEFWKYFKNTEAKLENIKDLNPEEQGKLLNDIKIELNKIDSNLNIEFSGQKKEVFITAGGIKTSFSDVEKLTAAAPDDLEWKVTAFKQRFELPIALTFDDNYSLDSNKIFFKVKESKNFLDVEINFENQDILQDMQKKQVAFIFLDAIIGEYDTEKYIGTINITESKDSTYLNAEDFRKEVDNFKKKLDKSQ